MNATQVAVTIIVAVVVCFGLVVLGHYYWTQVVRKKQPAEKTVRETFSSMPPVPTMPPMPPMPSMPSMPTFPWPSDLLELLKRSGSARFVSTYIAVCRHCRQKNRLRSEKQQGARCAACGLPLEAVQTNPQAKKEGAKT